MSMKERILGFWRLRGRNQRIAYLEEDVVLEVRDGYFWIVDSDDPTKRGMFQIGGLTPGSTRVYTLPDADTALGAGGGGGEGTPGGSTTEVQFNLAGSFTGDTAFTYTTADNTLHVETIDLVTPVTVADGGTGGGDASTARTNLGLAIGTNVQAHDADLDTIAALGANNDDVMQRKGGVWVASPMSGIKTDLVLAKGDVGLGNVDNTSDANKPVSTATQTALDAKSNNAGHIHTSSANGGQLTLASFSDVTASSAEINILDGVVSTTVEINKLSGLLPTTTELNYVDGVTSPIQTQFDNITSGSALDEHIQDIVGTTVVAGNNIDVTYSDVGGTLTVDLETLTLADISDITASTAEINVLDGVTASTAELNIVDGLTASTAELNKLDNVTATTAEINWLSGVTDQIQLQIDNKQNADITLTQIAAVTAHPGADRLIFYDHSALSWAHMTIGAGLTIVGTELDASGTMVNNPTFSDFSNANHDHADADDGGQLTDAALSTAVGIAKGGTGQTAKTAAFDALSPCTTQGDLIYYDGSDNIRLAKGTALQGLRMNSGATAPEWADHTRTQVKSIVVGDGVNVISTGIYLDFSMPVAGEWIRWRILATKFTSGTTGSIVFDLWGDTYANFPPVVGDSRSTSKPTLTTAASAEDSSITDWTTETFAAGDVFRLNVDSASTVTLCTLELWYTSTA